MILTITCDVDKGEEGQFRDALNGQRYRGILQELDNWLKREVENISPETWSEAVRHELYELCTRHDVSLWD